MSGAKQNTERNNIALIALMCGIISWVPLVALLAAPLTLVFAVWALFRARTTKYRRGTSAAFYGVALAAISVAIQFAVISTGSIVGAALGL